MRMGLYKVMLGSYQGYIGVIILGLYSGYTGVILGLY